MIKMFLGAMVTLLAITMQSCSNGDLPKQGSQNDYEYSFEVSAPSGDVHLIFSPTSDGSTPLLDGAESNDKSGHFYREITNSKHQVFRITTKQARKFSVKVDVLKFSSGGTWKFTERRNGKVIRTEQHTFKGGYDEEYKTYTSSTL